MILPIKARGDWTIHQVGYPASPAIPLAGVELGAVGGVGDHVALGVPGHSGTDLVIN